jgi:ATP-dependent exoDNAse (exonuclease V) beta subunit
VLYVALTRAREYLYVYGTVPKANYSDYIDGMRDILSPYFAMKAESFMDIILMSKSCGTLTLDPAFDTDEDSEDMFAENLFESAESEMNEENDVAAEDDGENEELTNEFLRRFSFTPPKHHLESLPEKVSVSRLSPTVLDDTAAEDTALRELFSDSSLFLYDKERAEDFEPGDEDSERDEDGERAEKAPTLPSFISGTPENESAKRGIATHTVLQFCDFELLEKCGARRELSRLVEKEFISKEDAERVRIRELDAFVKSPLFAEMKSAARLYRELRFNTKLPAGSFTKDEEKKRLLAGEEILVQGVIDCIIEHADGSLHLIDYKTDRLTREERSDPALADERMRRAHSLQLSYYSDAIELIFGKRPSRVGVYSLHAGREIDII